jgi:hypothetical protein
LPDAAVREARERVRAAVKNCGAKFPVSRITVNLAPAGQKKPCAGERKGIRPQGRSLWPQALHPAFCARSGYRMQKPMDILFKRFLALP